MIYKIITLHFIVYILLQHLTLPLEKYNMTIPIDKQVLISIWYLTNIAKHIDFYYM